MKDITISSPVTTGSRKRLSPPHLWELATRLFMFKAERWKRRAVFYERHRDYFPRLASGPFINRCRELEASYRALAQLMFLVPPEKRLVPIHVLALPKPVR